MITGILDTGVRANEGPPPSASWKSTPVFSGNGGWKIVSNKIAPNVAGASSAVWGTTFLVDNQEVYCNLDTFPETGNSFRLYLNLSGDNTASPNGYGLEFWHHTGGGVGDLSIKKLTAGVQSNLAVTSLTLVAGDVIGLRCSKGTIQSFVNDVQKNVVVDKIFTGAFIGIAIDAGSAARISSFGGGNLPAIVPETFSVKSSPNPPNPQNLPPPN